MDIKQELKYVIKKHKDDKLESFQTNIEAMASACLKEIEKRDLKISELEKVIAQYKEYTN